MSHQEQEPIHRTSPERTGKMMLIVVGICIAGGVIFFGMWDYWISAPPLAAGGTEVTPVEPVEATGVEIPIDLTFVESSDLRTLGFNALPGEPNANPTIEAEVGDKIIFDVTNGGISFHAFGVTAEESGFGGVIPGTSIASASNPLSAGQGGEAQFIPGEEGVYYYICTVPGHRELGMVGQIVVGDVEAPEPAVEPEPEMEPEPEPEAETTEPPVEVSEPEVETMPETMATFTGTISVAEGSSLPGCEETNECYTPALVEISVGETVTWVNDDTAAHTVTSGSLEGGPAGVFDSGLFLAGKTFEYTFDEAGEYPYFCMVHPWMTGKVIVK